MPGFNNPVVGGSGILKRKAIQSLNFVSGLTGWFLGENGDAQLNQLTIVISPDSGSIFNVVDGNGDVLFSISPAGDVVAHDVAANDDITLAGQSLLDDILPQFSTGIVSRGWAPSAAGSFPWPSPAIGTAETSLMELDFTIPNGATYTLNIFPADFIPTVSADTQIVMRARFTTDGTVPTTASTQFGGYSPGVLDIRSAASGKNLQSPPMNIPISNTSGADIVYKVLLTGQIQSGTMQFQTFLQMLVEDAGGLNSANQATILGTGSGGGSSKQTYTKTYNAIGCARYQGSTGHQPNTLIGINGTVSQGGDFSNTSNGDTYSWIAFPASIASDLAGATVNWVKLKLVNTHTWFNSGGTVQVGHTTTTTFPNTTLQPASIPDQVNQHFNEGQTLTFYVDRNGTTWGNAFQNGGARSVLMAANTGDLLYYMLFNGPASQLIINYTK